MFPLQDLNSEKQLQNLFPPDVETVIEKFIKLKKLLQILQKGPIQHSSKTTRHNGCCMTPIYCVYHCTHRGHCPCDNIMTMCPQNIYLFFT